MGNAGTSECKFDIGDVRKFVSDNGFETKYDERMGDIILFEAKKDDVSIAGTQAGKTRHVTVTVARKFVDVDYAAYKRVSSLASKLKDRLGVVRDGGHDAVQVWKDPDRYRLRDAAAAKLLLDAKTIRVSVTCTLDNRWNSVGEIDYSVRELG